MRCKVFDLSGISGEYLSRHVPTKKQVQMAVYATNGTKEHPRPAVPVRVFVEHEDPHPTQVGYAREFLYESGGVVYATLDLTEEGLHVVRQGWTGLSVSFAEEFSRIHHVALVRKPKCGTYISDEDVALIRELLDEDSTVGSDGATRVDVASRTKRKPVQEVFVSNVAREVPGEVPTICGSTGQCCTSDKNEVKRFGQTSRVKPRAEREPQRSSQPEESKIVGLGPWPRFKRFVLKVGRAVRDRVRSVSG